MPRDGDGVYTLPHDLVADKEAVTPIPPSAERFMELFDDIASQINDMDTAAVVTAQLAGKANAADVNAALTLKADTAAVNAALVLKADASDLGGKIDTAAAGTTLATLTDGYLTAAQIPPSIASPFRFRGTWNASTNTTAPFGGGTPGTLVSSAGTEGDLWRVSVSGTTSLDGNDNWVAGDELYFGGGVWNPLGSALNGLSQSDGRIVGFFRGNGHGGVNLRGFWTADNRIFQVGAGVNKANGDETATDNWFPVQVPWDASLGITSIVSGLASHYLIDANNHVWSWGKNDVGQLGHGDTTDRSIPVKIASLSSINIAEVVPSAVNGSGYAAAFFREATTGGAGRVWGCGAGANYIFGNSSTSNQASPVRVGTTTNVVEIAFANNNGPAFFRTTEPGIYVTGGPGGVANGLGTGAPAQTPQRLTALDNEGITKMAVGAGINGAVAVMLDGTGAPFICGTGTWGLGFGTSTTLTAFTEITSRPSGEVYDDVAVCGDYIVVAFRSTAGNLHLLGYGGTGVLGSGATTDMTSITAPTGSFQGHVTRIAIGGPDGNQTVAVETDTGVLWTCGFESVGQTAHGTYNRAAGSRVWGAVQGLDGSAISDWGWCGAADAAGLTIVLADGRVKTAGGNALGETGTQPGNVHAVTTLQDVKGLPSVDTLLAGLYAAAENAANAAAAYAASASASAKLWRQPGNLSYPGFNVENFSRSPAGAPDTGSTLNAGAATNGAWRLTNETQLIAMRDVTRVDAGRQFKIATALQVIADVPTTIAFGFVCLDAAYAEITPRQQATYAITAADGRKTLTHIIASALGGDGVTKAWNAGTVYVRPFVSITGSSHTTDVISVEVAPILEIPVSRSIAEQPLYTDWTTDTPWGSERRTRLAAGGPVIYRPTSNLIYLTIQYGDSTANSHSSGLNDRLPRHMTADVFPYALMLDCPYAPGVDVTSATISATAFANYCDRANVGTSTAAMGQPEGIGTACRRVLQKRERRQAQELRGYAPLGIGGARLEHIKKGGTLMSGVQMWTRLTNAVQKWIDIAAQYGMTVNVEAVHVSIGSNDTAAAYTGGLAAYKADLQTLFGDLQTDLKALTGQSANPIIAFGTTSSTVEALVPSIALAQLADFYRGSTEIMPLGPEYAFAYASSNHLDIDATVLCGERLAHRMIFGLAASGNRPKVLYPSAVNWTGNTCVLTIADATTLVIDTDSVPAHAKYGFDCATLAISSVAVSTNTITVTFASDPPSGTVLTHAQGPHTDANLLPTVTGVSRGWGNIRNTRSATFNIRSKIIPSWDRANATLQGRVLNGRDCYFDDWLYNFEVTKP